MVDEKPFHEWLNEQMKIKDWSQADLARAASLDSAVIHKILAQKTQCPSNQTCGAIARALKLSPATVIRVAKGLPPELEFPGWQDFKELLSQVSESGRKEIFANIQVKIAIEQKGDVSVH